MPSPIVAATLQTTSLALVSSLLAQARPLIIDWVPVLQYLVYTIISTPPNFQWQQLLESSFPARPNPKTPSLSRKNTAVKLLLDQSLAAAANTLLYSTFSHSLRAAMPHAPVITDPLSAAKHWSALDFSSVDLALVWRNSLDDFWPLLLAGARLWPLVAIVNYTLVSSVQARNLLSALAGVAWGVYLCL